MILNDSKMQNRECNFRLSGKRPTVNLILDKLEEVCHRLDVIEQRLDRVEQRLDRLEQRVDRLEKRLDNIVKLNHLIE